MNIYEEVEIEDMEYDPTSGLYHYQCPCGDKFVISLDELHDGKIDIQIDRQIDRQTDR